MGLIISKPLVQKGDLLKLLSSLMLAARPLGEYELKVEESSKGSRVRFRFLSKTVDKKAVKARFSKAVLGNPLVADIDFYKKFLGEKRRVALKVRAPNHLVGAMLAQLANATPDQLIAHSEGRDVPEAAVQNDHFVHVC